MVVLTVLIHGAGIADLARALRFGPSNAEAHHHFSLRQAMLLLVIVLTLFSLLAAEIWSYGVLDLLPGAVSNPETVIYFSTITYADIGFDDAEMAHRWRLVGAIEGVKGLILLGWSIACFVTVVARLRKQKVIELS